MRTDSRRERRVVTVVFCDLVGFTSRAETLDPEDVEALLSPYHARVRSELERHGGTVEKFIGDAVMALFGAPTAHEDDPERAARAALAIRDFAVEEGLELRVGITTGEALIRIDARPEAGEGMASGDVINTAARLQSAAPVNGALVDETTYRATRGVIDYRAADALEAKGKAEPVAVWEALTANARFGVDVAHEARTELVGRKRELGVLRDAFARARHERVPQLVTLVGVPGIGKSRLVYELSQFVDADSDLVTWRQGRCLAYGDGVTLWALGEIVKAQAGIVEQDGRDDVAAKVRRAVEEVVESAGDVDWVESQLLPLVGLASAPELGGDRRGSAFAAWRLFLEALADQRPLVLVFEDLHWADESLLDFVDELVDWITEAPLIVVCTARPELLERRPGWGGGKLNAATLALSPLTDDETALLLGRLLDRSVLPAEDQRALLERAGGNPLYAEQFADLFTEHGSAERLGLPETLQGLIAARLDALSPDEKHLLRDASVVGKVFWAGALGRDAGDARQALHSLERKGFVRRQKRSSVEGEVEYGFAHALVRDVAYGQLARADRAARHVRAAEWIESLGRPEDHAEMYAHHWRAALDLARAAGAATDDLVTPARLALRAAGDRALALNSFPAAARYYADALELWPADDAERPHLLFSRANALHVAADERRQGALEEARDALLEAGQRDVAAEAEALLAHGAWYRGQRDVADAHLERAVQLLAGAKASPATARVLAITARLKQLAFDEDDLELAREALALAERLSLDELRAHALLTLGMALNHRDRSLGTAEAEQALELALAVNSPIAGVILNNLGVMALRNADLETADRLTYESARVSERFGDANGLRFVRGNMPWGHFVRGRWEEAARTADEFIAECESSPHTQEGLVRGTLAALALARGDRERALAETERSVELSRAVRDPQQFLPRLAQAARVYLELGLDGDARTHATEALELARQHVAMTQGLIPIVPYAHHLGITEEVGELIERLPAGPWADLARAHLDGDHVRAADITAAAGAPMLEALARLRAAEALVAEGRRPEAEEQAQLALGFFRPVGASFYVERLERLLASAQRDSA